MDQWKQNKQENELTREVLEGKVTQLEVVKEEIDMRRGAKLGIREPHSRTAGKPHFLNQRTGVPDPKSDAEGWPPNVQDAWNELNLWKKVLDNDINHTRRRLDTKCEGNKTVLEAD